MPNAKQCTRCGHEDTFADKKDLRAGWSRVRSVEWPQNAEVEEFEEVPSLSDDPDIRWGPHNEAVDRNNKRVTRVFVRREDWLCPTCTLSYHGFRSELHAMTPPKTSRTATTVEPE